MYFLGVIVLLEIFYFAGYVIRLSSNSVESVLLYPYEIAGGYALSSLILLVSLFLAGSMLPGAVLMICASIFSILFLLWRKRINGPAAEFPFRAEHGVCVAFSFVVCVIYYNAIAGNNSYSFIFDLPKHLSAITTGAHSQGFPLTNPWYPDGTFVYNSVVYLPMSLLSKLFQAPPILIFTGFAVWVCWISFYILKEILKEFNCTEASFALAMFLFFSGSILPFFTEGISGHRSRFPYNLYMIVEVQVLWWIFLPPQLFSIALFLGGYTVYRRYVGWKGLLLLGVLTSIACLCSYGLLPIMTLLYGSICVYELALCLKWKRKISITSAGAHREVRDVAANLPYARGANEPVGTLAKRILEILPGAVVFMLLVLGIAGRDMLEQSTVALTESPEIIATISGAACDLAYSFIAYAPFCVCACLGVYFLTKEKNKTSYHLFVPVTVTALIVLAYVAYNFDFILKGMTTLWMLLTPYAAKGILGLTHGSRVRKVCANVLLIILAFISVPVVSHFAGASDQALPNGMTDTVRYINALPSDARVACYLKSPVSNQDFAAMLNKPVFINFTLMRKDAYLPAADQSEANKFFALNLTNPEDIAEWREYQFDYVVEYNANAKNAVFNAFGFPVEKRYNFIVYDTSDKTSSSVILTLNNIEWEKVTYHSSIGKDKSKANIPMNSFSSSSIIDGGLRTPISLEGGTYALVARVKSNLTDGDGAGSAWIGLEDYGKIFSTYDIAYNDSSVNYFDLKEDYEGYLVAGLGGWGSAAGSIDLDELILYRLEKGGEYGLDTTP